MNPIKRQNVIEEGIFDEAASSAKKLIAVLNNLKTGFKKVMESVEKVEIKFDGTFESFEKLADIAALASKANLEYAATQKNIKNVEEEMFRIREAKAKALTEEVKLQRALKEEEKKRIKDSLKNESDNAKRQIGAYAELSKKLNELRKQYKDLAAVGDTKNSFAKNLLYDIRVLDAQLKKIDGSVGQFQRSVGNYKKGIASFASTFKANLAANVTSDLLTGIVGKMKDIFSTSESGIEIIGRFNAALEIGAQKLYETVKIGYDFIKLGAIKGINQVEKFALKAATIYRNTLSLFGQNTQAADADIQSLTTSIAANEAAILDLEKSGAGLSDSYTKVKAVFSSATTSIEATNKAYINLTRTIVQAQKDSNKLAIEQSRLSAVSEGYRFILSNEVENLHEKARVSKELMKVNEAEIAIATKLAQKQLEIAQLRVRAENLAKTGKDEMNVAKANLSTQKQYADAVVALNEVVTNSFRIRGEAMKELFMAESDIFEQRMDFEIDIAEGIATANDKIINSDKVSLEEKNKVAKETAKLLNESYTRQLSLASDYEKAYAKLQVEIASGEIARMDSLGKMTDLEKKQYDGLIAKRDQYQKAIDTDSLTTFIDNYKAAIAKGDSVLVESLVNQSLLSEKGKNVLLNIGKSRIANKRSEVDNLETLLSEETRIIEAQGVIDGATEYVAALEKFKGMEFKTRKEYDAAKKNLDAARAKEEVAQLKGAVEQIETEITKAKKFAQENGLDTFENSVYLLELEGKLAEAKKKLLENELAEKQAYYEKTHSLDEQAFEKRKAIVESYIQLGENLVNEIYTRQEAAIDKKLNRTQANISRLETMAALGSQKSIDNLAFEVKQEADLAAERERIAKSKQRAELLFSVIKTYSKYAGDPNVTNPFQKTLEDTLKLQALVASLPSFDKGTEYLESVSNGGVDGKGGRPIIAHTGERIIPAALNRQIIGLSSQEIITRATRPNYLSQTNVNQNTINPNQMFNLDFLNDKLDKLIKVTENKETYKGFEFNEHEKVIKHRYVKNNTIKTVTERVGGIL